MRGERRTNIPLAMLWGEVPWNSQPGSNSCNWVKSSSVPQVSWRSTTCAPDRQPDKKPQLSAMAPGRRSITNIGAEERRGVPRFDDKRSVQEVGDTPHRRRGGTVRRGAWWRLGRPAKRADNALREGELAELLGDARGERGVGDNLRDADGMGVRVGVGPPQGKKHTRCAGGRVHRVEKSVRVRPALAVGCNHLLLEHFVERMNAAAAALDWQRTVSNDNDGLHGAGVGGS